MTGCCYTTAAFAVPRAPSHPCGTPLNLPSGSSPLRNHLGQSSVYTSAPSVTTQKWNFAHSKVSRLNRRRVPSVMCALPRPPCKTPQDATLHSLDRPHIILLVLKRSASE